MVELSVLRISEYVSLNVAIFDRKRYNFDQEFMFLFAIPWLCKQNHVLCSRQIKYRPGCS